MEDILPKSNVLVVSGLPRAASTLLFNIVRLSAKEIFSNTLISKFSDKPLEEYDQITKNLSLNKEVDGLIIHTHNLNESILLPFKSLFSCYRKPIDALFSCHRKYFLTKNNSIRFLKEYSSNLKHLKNQSIISRFHYDTLVDDPEFVISSVFKKISLKKIDIDTLKKIRDQIEYIKKRNQNNQQKNKSETMISNLTKKIMKKLGRSLFENDEDRLHPNHISKGKYFVDKKYIKNVVNSPEIKTIIEEANYFYEFLTNEDLNISS